MGRRRKGGPIEIVFGIWLLGGIFFGGFKSPWIYIMTPIIGIVIVLLANLIIHHMKQEEEKRHMKALKEADIDSMEGIMFEKYIAAILEHRGFKTSITKGSGDFGVDIIASRDNQRYAVQVKRYRSNVSRTAVSDAVAGKKYYDCNIAMVITNSYFSPAAIDLADKNHCKLVNRNVLADWINEFKGSQRSHASQSYKRQDNINYWYL